MLGRKSWSTLTAGFSTQDTNIPCVMKGPSSIRRSAKLITYKLCIVGFRKQVYLYCVKS
jgi:hypothetical protein